VVVPAGEVLVGEDAALQAGVEDADPSGGTPDGQRHTAAWRGLLFAALLGALLVLVAGVACLLQLRRLARRHRRADQGPERPG
jgi:hypothetical protein